MATDEPKPNASLGFRADRFALHPSPGSRTSMLWVVLAISGCFSANPDAAASGGSDDLENPPPAVPPVCPQDETTCEDECQGGNDCASGQVCAAAFDPDRGGITVTQCRTACIPLDDEASWCVDDGSCCDPEARCTSRGYCVLPGSQSGSESGSTTAGPNTPPPGTDSTDTGPVSTTGSPTTTSTETTDGSTDTTG